LQFSATSTVASRNSLQQIHATYGTITPVWGV
jgi:hypothetical protein